MRTAILVFGVACAAALCAACAPTVMEMDLRGELPLATSDPPPDIGQDYWLTIPTAEEIDEGAPTMADAMWVSPGLIIGSCVDDP